MKNRKLGISLSTLGFITAMVSMYLDNYEDAISAFSIFKYGGVLLLMIGAIITYLSASAYVFEFSSRSWTKDKNDVILNLPYTKHGKKDPISRVFEREGETFQEVSLVIQNLGHDVQIRSAGKTFAGKIIIK